ncbi:MAG: S8 family serine peptidase [Candidatus Eremiobacteraeota bacterium]|nr:S8 family serine peptidase [Candidatus Eremiobacteraeota bacterium]
MRKDTIALAACFQALALLAPIATFAGPVRWSASPLQFASLAQSGRTIVTDETQLPRFAYPMPMAPSKLVVADDATFAPFLRAVESDVEKTLAQYDITDKATLRDYLATRLAGQLLSGDTAGIRVTVAALRAAETKPSRALLAGRLELAVASGSFAQADRTAVFALPWSVVGDSVKDAAGFEPVQTRDGVVGNVAHDFDPIAAKSGTLDGPSGRQLVRLRAALVLLPLLPQDVQILQAYIARHDTTKPDIWAMRDVTLAPSQVKAPVRIGILDSGVDPHDYPMRMYGGAGAVQHGLAFADDGTPSSSDLYPVPADVASDYPKIVKLLTGFSDMESGIVSPDAAAAAAYLRSLDATQEAAFEREMDVVGEYAHGSHVAGIASRGNPGAQIVVARFDDNLPNLAFAPTVEWARRMAQDFAAIGAFFRERNVRVVNMSWGDQVSEFEQWLAKTDATADPQARKQKAQELYAIWRTAIEAMIRDTPGTLFVAAAGNGDNDATFAQDVPGSLVYPNLLTVGAVNQAGDSTSFTSYGPTVAVYADGFHVPSKIPQGYTVKFSGTSMAAPNVTNLAGKLFALNPALTPRQVRALILEGATTVPGGKLKLIDPKRSIALLRAAR